MSMRINRTVPAAPYMALQIDLFKYGLDFLHHTVYDALMNGGAGDGDMRNEWHVLTDLIGERPFVVTSVRIEKTGVDVSGQFELPPLAQLRYEDQVFVSEFVRSHGSIKEMEKAFGISYPTVKNRLNRIASQLQFVEVAVESPMPDSVRDVLDSLERGEITADEAAERMRG